MLMQNESGKWVEVADDSPRFVVIESEAMAPGWFDWEDGLPVSHHMTREAANNAMREHAIASGRRGKSFGYRVEDWTLTPAQVEDLYRSHED